MIFANPIIQSPTNLSGGSPGMAFSPGSMAYNSSQRAFGDTLSGLSGLFSGAFKGDLGAKQSNPSAPPQRSNETFGWNSGSY